MKLLASLRSNTELDFKFMSYVFGPSFPGKDFTQVASSRANLANLKGIPEFWSVPVNTRASSPLALLQPCSARLSNVDGSRSGLKELITPYYKVMTVQFSGIGSRGRLLFVFPIEEGGKTPVCSHVGWNYYATLYPEKIRMLKAGRVKELLLNQYPVPPNHRPPAKKEYEVSIKDGNSVFKQKVFADDSDKAANIALAEYAKSTNQNVSRFIALSKYKRTFSVELVK